MLPPGATSWAFARPRALYDHPQLGPILARTFDDASERALIRRVERTGYDVRTLDRAAIAWTPRGDVYFAQGPLDAALIASRLWERLLSPRRRGRDPQTSDERVEGLAGRTLVSLLVVPACGTAAYAEGSGVVRAVDRVVVPNTAPDPAELAVWHSSHVPDPLARAEGTALDHSVREIDVRVRTAAEALRVTLTLHGALPSNAGERVRRALAAVVDSPLGDLIGAVQWLRPERIEMQQTADELRATVEIPWRALSALADAMRGTVGQPMAR